MPGGRALMVASARWSKEAEGASIQSLQKAEEKARGFELVGGGVAFAGLLISLGSFMLMNNSPEPETVYSLSLFTGAVVFATGSKLAIAFDLARRTFRNELETRGETGIF